MQSNQAVKTVIIFAAKILVIVALGYLLFSKISWQEIWEHLKKANIYYLTVALFLSIASMIVSSLRSWFYFKQYGFDASKRFFIRLYSVGAAFNILLPGGIGGDGYKVLAIYRESKFPKLTSLRLMLYERANGFFILVLLGLVMAINSTFIQLYWPIKYFIYISLGLIIPCYLWGVKYVLRDNPVIALEAARYSLLVQILQYAMYVIILYGLWPTLGYQNVIDLSVLFGVASIVAILPISIGGIGLREVTFLYGSTLLTNNIQELAVSSAVLVFFMQVLTGGVGLLFLLLSAKHGNLNKL